jgi:hypothetical protein
MSFMVNRLSRMQYLPNIDTVTVGQKKLLTLAGAIGILACGACFGPSNYKPPPPPPIQIDLRGIHTISVEVTDTSEAHHLDATALSQRVHDVLNIYRNGTGVTAAEPGKPPDATLKITLLDAQAIAGPPAAERMSGSGGSNCVSLRR